MSCLFNSLGKLLEINSDELRNNICDFIIKNSHLTWNDTKLQDWIKMVAGDRFTTFHNYIKQMRNRSEWGGAPEIAVCCMMYDVSIEVLHRVNGTLQEKILFEESSQKNIKKKNTFTYSNFKR